MSEKLGTREHYEEYVQNCNDAGIVPESWTLWQIQYPQPVASEPVQREVNASGRVIPTHEEVYGDMTPAEIAEYQAQQDSLYEANEARQAAIPSAYVTSVGVKWGELNEIDQWYEYRTTRNELEALRKELDEARAANVALVAENTLLVEGISQIKSYAHDGSLTAETHEESTSLDIVEEIALDTLNAISKLASK